jgi:hypothetical protein
MGISNASQVAQRPVTRPSFTPGASTPSAPTNRPSLGNVSRPSISPPGVATLPATRPSPGGDRPGIANRPGIDTRPGIGNRPGIDNRPGIGNRPDIGNRPVIGGGNVVNRPGGNNNFVNINNRPGWGMGDTGHWRNDWYDHHVPPHHQGWYHGCWPGNWGRYWYAPVVVGGTLWGLNALLPSWGYAYGYTYANPYYVESTMPTYDYSQPVVINNYNAPAEGAPAAPPAESPETTEAYRLFDQALAAFKKGDYRGALPLVEQARGKAPNDPAMHEVAALCLFATGDYARAAAILNSLLAAAPGMDWTTLSGLYGNAADYTTQLRALERYCQQKPDDAAARFVLAYHYLVGGHDTDATAQLKLVVAEQPEDQVAKRMLEALSPPEPASQAAAPAPPAAAPAAETGPTTDLVGVWRAQRDGDTFDLSIDAESRFAWKATPKGKPPVNLAGTMTTAGDAMLLQSQDQGTMVAQVKSGGTDQFQFVTAGSPSGDPGLSFQRVKPNP